MLNTITGSTILISVALLTSCSGEQNDKGTSRALQETPEMLQDDNTSLKSYSRSYDLIDELYQELVEKTPALKKLEDDLEAINPKQHDLVEKFNTYDDKSARYYYAAEAQIKNISDSVLNTKIKTLIANSNKQYANNNATRSALLKQITQNNATLRDRHTVLKIVLTLPLLEKYQHDNIPDKKYFNDVIESQEEQIKKIDTSTPPY